MIRVALFSHDHSLERLLGSALGREFELEGTTTRAGLSSLLAEDSYDVVLLDVDPDAAGPDDYVGMLREIQEFSAAVVVMCDDTGRSIAVELVQLGAHSDCRKPPAMREVKAILRRAYEYATMRRQIEPKRKPRQGSAEAVAPGCGELIGSSARMRTVYGLIQRVAGLNASVLVTGESGTGKELIARAIHDLGPRKNQPFVAVSCGAIPETLIESELFGHEKGAFTGSAGTRTGYFEQAGAGTLFLDEIGELSPQTQVKLLRVLQQREFMRLGSSRTVPLRARIVFATHRDLSRMIADGKFRLDLYYRINVVTIHAPSLAEKPEDIALLTNHFIEKYSEAYGKYMSGIDSAAMRLLEEYDWPGNVRELENVIQSAIITAESSEIRAEDLPERLRPQQTAEVDDVIQAGTFERLLRDYRVKVALKAIEDCQGNKTLAARSLDISRAYLHRLIRDAGVVEAIDVA